MRTVSAAVLAFFALAAPALADDPLLSGYSGPGGMDQSLIGGGLIGGGSSGSGGSGSGARRGSGSLRAPAAPVAQPAPGAEGSLADVSAAPRVRRTPTAVAGAPARATRTAPAPAGTPTRSSGAAAGSPSSAEPSARAAAGAPAAVSRAATADGGSAFPVSLQDLLLVLLGGGVLLAVARATARLRGPAVPST